MAAARTVAAAERKLEKLARERVNLETKLEGKRQQIAAAIEEAQGLEISTTRIAILSKLDRSRIYQLLDGRSKG